MTAEERTAAQVAFEAQVRAYLEYLDGVRNLSAHTVRGYESDLAAFCDWVRREGVVPAEATHRDFRRYLAFLRRSGYATRTVNRHLSAVRGLYQWLLHEDLVHTDAAAALSGPKLAQTLPRTMGDADVGRLLATCDASSVEGSRDRAFLELLYATGARISEIARLDVDTIDRQAGQVRLYGKGSKERVVPVYRRAVEEVERYLQTARPLLAARRKGEPTRALFVSTRGNRMSADALRTCFERHARLAGLDAGLTPHAMRHTYATELLTGGADLRSVQELLGHESLATTQIYTHLSVERLKEATRRAHPRGT